MALNLEMPWMQWIPNATCLYPPFEMIDQVQMVIFHNQLLMLNLSRNPEIYVMQKLDLTSLVIRWKFRINKE